MIPCRLILCGADIPFHNLGTNRLPRNDYLFVFEAFTRDNSAPRLATRMYIVVRVHAAFTWSKKRHAPTSDV